MWSCQKRASRCSLFHKSAWAQLWESKELSGAETSPLGCPGQGTVPRFHGTMVPWSHGSTGARLSARGRGTIEPWHGGPAISRRHPPAIPRYHRSMEPWYHGTAGARPLYVTVVSPSRRGASTHPRSKASRRLLRLVAVAGVLLEILPWMRSSARPLTCVSWDR